MTKQQNQAGPIELDATALESASGGTDTSAGTHALYQDAVIPSATTADSYYGRGVLKSTDSGRTW